MIKGRVSLGLLLGRATTKLHMEVKFGQDSEVLHSATGIPMLN